jgi:hypothetical protein
MKQEPGKKPGLKCALCDDKAAWKSTSQAYCRKPSYYCDFHKRVGLAFGFLEAHELEPLNHNIRGFQ